MQMAATEQQSEKANQHKQDCQQAQEQQEQQQREIENAQLEQENIKEQERKERLLVLQNLSPEEYLGQTGVANAMEEALGLVVGLRPYNPLKLFSDM